MKKYIIALALLALGATAALAVEATKIYTCRTTASGTAWASPCYDSTPSATWATSSGTSTAPNNPVHPGSFYRTLSTTTVGRGWGCTLGTDTTANLRWIVYVTVPLSSSTAAGLYSISSPNALLEQTRGGAIATQTDAFQSTKGGNKWGFVCFATVTGGTGLHPTINFGYLSGGTGSERAQAEAIMFVPDIPCLATTAIPISPPYTTDMTSFNVTAVTAGATMLAVYKQMGSGAKELVGLLDSGIVAGANTVPLLPGATLEKNVSIFATQTVGGQEGCDHLPQDYQVGIGNSNLKFCFYMGNDPTTPKTGPIGAAGGTAGSLYFMPQVMNDAASFPKEGVDIPLSSCWQTVTIDPRTATHGNYNAGATSGDPWASGRPAFQVLNSFCFLMADTNSGPYEVYIDNFDNGGTLIHNWEDSTNINGYPAGLFATYGNEGSTSPLLTGTTPPLAMSTVVTGTNAAPANQYAGGTNAQYLKWQWKTVSTSGGVWNRKACTAAGEGASWPSNPQVDMYKPIHFDVLLAPPGSTPHSVGTVTWMDDQTNCPASSATFSITAKGPGDPAHFGQSLPRTFTYQWSKNGTAIPGASGSAIVGPTDPPATISFTSNNVMSADVGTYSVVVSDGTCSLTRSSILTVPQVVSIDTQPTDQGPFGFPYDTSFSVGASIDPLCPCAKTPPLTYQWFFNGTAIPGATDATLPVHIYDLSSAGSYTVVVSNTCAAQWKTSSIAKLYVTDPDVTPITASCSGNQGLLGLYWTNQTSANAFTGAPTWTNNPDWTVDFDWVTAGPTFGVYAPTDSFAIRWIARVQPYYANQTYTFYTKSDDGVRLWVKGQLLIDKWVPQSATEWSGSIDLASGPVDLILEYFEQTGNASVTLSWDSVSVMKAIVPTAQLCAANPATDIPPLTTLTAPANNATATLPTPVTLTASVTPESATVNKVAFYNNGTTLLATVNAPGPYTTSWTPPATGVYNITARTYYNTTHTLNTPSNKLTVNPALASAVTISNISGTTITYGGGAGSRFVLMTFERLNVPLSSWTRVATNTATPGTFTIPAVGSADYDNDADIENQAYYIIKSE